MGDNKCYVETSTEFSIRMTDVAYKGMTCLDIAMGKETGLLDLMISTETPRTSQEISEAGYLNKSFVSKWLSSMVSSHIVDYDSTSDTYWIPIHRHCIMQVTELALFTPVLSSAFFEVAKCFKKDGPSEIGVKVLDVGCGSGIFTAAIAKRFPRSDIYGMDLSESCLKKAREQAKAAGLTNVYFVCQDACALPSNWMSVFNYALVHMSLHHFADPSRVVKEIRRVLAPEGTLSVVDPKAHSKLEDNLEKDCAHASMLYTISMIYDVPTTLAMGKGKATGAVFGREKTTELLEESGYHVDSVNESLGALHYLCMKSLIPTHQQMVTCFDNNIEEEGVHTPLKSNSAPRQSGLGVQRTL